MRKIIDNQFIVTIILLVILASFTFPFANAEDADPSPTGLVPCGTKTSPPCSPCHIFVLTQNIYNFIIGLPPYTPGLVIPIAALMFIYGGFLMVFPGLGGSADALSKGKKVIANTLIGLAIIFFAWLGVDTIIKVLVGKQDVGSGVTAIVRLNSSSFGPWNIIQCSESAKSSSVPSGGQTPSQGQQQASSGGTPKTASGIKIGPCQQPCVNITEKTGIACKDGCNANEVFVQRLAKLNELVKAAGFTNPARVTEGHPPTVFHNDACHAIGTCVDLAAIGAASPQWIKAVVDNAPKACLRVEYETGSPGIYEGLKKTIPVAQTGQTSGLRFFAGTGDHFSVYMASSC